MPRRTDSAGWQDTAPGGSGDVRTESGTLAATYSFPSRFESGDGSNPEELLGAAHAPCYAMALSLLLGQQGYQVDLLDADASVGIEEVEGKPTITGRR